MDSSIYEINLYPVDSATYNKVYVSNQYLHLAFCLQKSDDVIVFFSLWITIFKLYVILMWP